MSSDCKLARAAALAGVLAAAGCVQEPAGPSTEALPATSMPQSPVGPVPGVAVEAPRRNPVEGDDRALAQGRRFFLAYNGAGCHGDHGGGGMGPSLRDGAWIYGGTDEDIADSIAQGRAHGMPSWGRMLTPTQVWQLTAYIRSLRTEREPNPPL
jgi:cytochrome c oxidase cbb3-type subunit 3